MTTGFFFRNVSYNDDAITSFSNVEFFYFIEHFVFEIWTVSVSVFIVLFIAHTFGKLYNIH